MQMLPKEIYLPKIAFVFNQIKHFRGNGLSTKRMELASKLLLESSLNVSEIAKQVGYNDPNSFTTQFTKYMGTPRL